MTATSTGARIRAAREAAGLTQADVARLCGWTRGRQHQLEVDWRDRAPTVETARKLAKAIGIPWASLFEG